jgi:predicted Rossmann-fold nucleotide-binding protein
MNAKVLLMILNALVYANQSGATRNYWRANVVKELFVCTKRNAAGGGVGVMQAQNRVAIETNV